MLICKSPSRECQFEKSPFLFFGILQLNKIFLSSDLFIYIKNISLPPKKNPAYATDVDCTAPMQDSDVLWAADESVPVHDGGQPVQPLPQAPGNRVL